MLKTTVFCFILVACSFILFTNTGFLLAFQGVGEVLNSIFSFADSLGH